MIIFRVVLAAVTWMALWGSFEWGTVIGGILVGLLIVSFSPTWRQVSGFIQLRRLIPLMLWSTKSVVESAVRVGWAVLDFRHPPQPGYVNVQLHESRPARVALIAHIVTLSPGTVSVDYNAASKMLQVHAFSINDANLVERDVHRLERYVADHDTTDDTVAGEAPCSPSV